MILLFKEGIIMLLIILYEFCLYFYEKVESLFWLYLIYLKFKSCCELYIFVVLIFLELLNNSLLFLIYFLII